jgi:hypothetical protein
MFGNGATISTERIIIKTVFLKIHRGLLTVMTPKNRAVLKEFKEVALLFAAMNIAYDTNPAAGAMERLEAAVII